LHHAVRRGDLHGSLVVIAELWGHAPILLMLMRHLLVGHHLLLWWLLLLLLLLLLCLGITATPLASSLLLLHLRMGQVISRS